MFSLNQRDLAFTAFHPHRRSAGGVIALQTLSGQGQCAGHPHHWGATLRTQINRFDTARAGKAAGKLAQ
jgi:hypothetical protein